MDIPISKISELQKVDIEHDKECGGLVYYDKYARVCTVFTGSPRDIGDRSPWRMAEMFGGFWKEYNNHFVVQVAGCPLDCSYCYVDNLREDVRYSAISLVTLFKVFQWHVYTHFHETLKVFHLMGGAPAAYCSFWPELRAEMDHQGFEDVVLFSNTILVEGHTRSVEPWRYMDLPRFIVEGCLKGTNRKNFKRNTGRDLFGYALLELHNYIRYPNFYLSLINYNRKDLPFVYQWMDRSRVDLLEVVEYEVTKAKEESYGHESKKNK